MIWANDSTTTKGWVVATKGAGANDENLGASAGHGIAVFNYNVANVTQPTLNADYDHGIGAFYLVDQGNTPELYIQVA